jgi:integrase
MTEIVTWKQGMDYTFNTRHSWKHGGGQVSTRINCNHFTEFAGADYPLKDITRKFLKSYQHHCEDLEIPGSTINRRISPITTVLNHLYDEEEIEYTPPKVKQYKESQGRPWFFTKEEVDELCAITNHRLSEIIRFASCTGGRMNELLSVKAKDVDLDKNCLYFGGRPGFNTKNGDWRVVPIATPIRKILEQRVIGTHPDCCIFGDEWHHGRSVLWYFKKATKQIGKEPHYVFHSLRHSFATWNVEAGVPLRVLMDLGGWKKYETVLRYAKATDKARDQALSSVFN